jgi:hypothetical protein
VHSLLDVGLNRRDAHVHELSNLVEFPVEAFDQYNGDSLVFRQRLKGRRKTWIM